MKPLLITDCDEVLLHMVKHFGTWLGEAHDVDFVYEHGEMAQAMRARLTGEVLPIERMWELLDGFFPAEMERQTLVPHAREGLERLAEIADIVILTNVKHHCRPERIRQLDAHGIRYRVECNQGPKGPPVARLREEHGNPVTVFIDDLAVHHASVADAAPEVHRLHMVSEPALAPHIPAAPRAHARIDDWREAADWIAQRFAQGRPAGSDGATGTAAAIEA